MLSTVRQLQIPYEIVFKILSENAPDIYMEEKPCLYSILGVTPAATLEEIKRAYRGLAAEYHPDKNKSPDAAGRFREISDAYELLCEETKKVQYDLQLRIQTGMDIHAEEVDYEEFIEISSDMLERPCRCGYAFGISRSQFDQGYRLIQCSGCSLCVKIV